MKKNFLLGLSESLNKHELAVEELLSTYKQLTVVDKALSLFKLDEEGRAIKVNQHFFASFGLQPSDMRYLEYLLFDQELHTHLYYGSWKWSHDHNSFSGYDHIGVFTTDTEIASLDQVIFTGYNKYGKKSASYHVANGKYVGNVMQSTPPWYNKQRVGFWIDTQTIASGSITANVSFADGQKPKVHMQFDRCLTNHTSTGFGGSVASKRFGFEVTWDNHAEALKTIYSNGVKSP